METDFPNYYTAAVLTKKHAPLREFYDWVGFQRQIHYAGIDHQLGGYIPHTPVTMLPFLPLTVLSPQRAKQVWLVLQLALLAASIFLLVRISRLPGLQVLVLCLLSYSALSTNFRLGQYYIFVLSLLVAGFYCLLRGRETAGGALLGLIFALKLYTAPFALYFVARRQWRALLGFLGAVGCLCLVAAVLFGWSDVWFFVNTVMARAIDGSVNDPYNPGWKSMTAFLRRTFVAEPELNPHPTWNAPAVFFFLRTAYTLAVLGISLVALANNRRDRESQALAWFVIVLFALSPNEATYHFVLLAAPVVLLLSGAPRVQSIILIAAYVAIELPLFSWDAKLFPKAWLVLGLFLCTGWSFLREIRPMTAGAAILAVLGIATAVTFQRMRTYRTEARQISQLAILEPAGIYSGAPALSDVGWVHEAMDHERYLLRASAPTGIQNFEFDGDTFHPTVLRSGQVVAFELAANGHSRICLLDPVTSKLQVVVEDLWNATEPALSPDGAKLAFISNGSLYLNEAGANRLLMMGDISNPAFFPDGERIIFAKGPPGRRIIQWMAISGTAAQTFVERGDCFNPAVSPDARRLAYTCSTTGGRHIWVRDFISTANRRLTYGFCNNNSPAWERDSQSIVFASDCNRGLGLTALYRLRIAGAENRPPDHFQ
jgi:hypothetical protein